MTPQEWRAEMWQEELTRRFAVRAQQEFRKGALRVSKDARMTAWVADRWLRGQSLHG